MWKYNFKVTLDLSHYQVYSNYLLYEKENNNTAGDLERQIYDANVPSWKDCINIVVGNSLVQLHFSDAKGTDRNGESCLFLTIGYNALP